jgi:hypothetical protein
VSELFLGGIDSKEEGESSWSFEILREISHLSNVIYLPSEEGNIGIQLLIVSVISI